MPSSYPAVLAECITCLDCGIRLAAQGQAFCDFSHRLSEQHVAAHLSETHTCTQPPSLFLHSIQMATVHLLLSWTAGGRRRRKKKLTS